MSVSNSHRHCFKSLGLSLLFLFAWSTPGALGADTRKNIHFQRLSVEDGLSSSEINHILQDHHGFMWFATQEGLNRFDGYRFKEFSHNPGDPKSLSDNWIWTILEDSAGVIWVGTGNGLNRFNPVDQTFTSFSHDSANPHSLSHNRVRVLCEDSNGTLWIGTDGGGLNRYNPDSEEKPFTRFTHLEDDPTSLSNNSLRCLLPDGNGGLWVGSNGGGLSRFQSGRFTHFRYDPDDPTSLSDNSVISLLKDKQGALWVGTIEGGLNRLDPGNIDSGHFQHFRHDPKNPRSLASNSVQALYQDNQGSLWVATDNGLDEWQEDSASFTHYRHDPLSTSSLSENRVTALFQDRGGVLWVGTGNGLNKWNATTGFFQHYRQNNDGSGLSSNFVNGFHEGKNKELWIVTYNGLNRLDRQTGTYRTYRHDPKDENSLSENRTYSLLIDSQDMLWVGTLRGGLNRFNPADESFQRFRHDPNRGDSLSANAVPCIYEDPQKRLWVGTYRGGLNLLNRETGGFTRYRHDSNIPTSLSNDRVLDIVADSNSVLWICTDGGGFNRFDPATETFTSYRHDPRQGESISNDRVWVVHESRAGDLWLGTFNGLNRWMAADRAAHRPLFQRYDKQKSGLPSSVIYAILEDDDGNLWIGTNQGLAKLEPGTGQVRNYDVDRGLQGREFNAGAYFKSADGEMFFGGLNGFNAFYPDQIFENRIAPPVLLTAFRKFNREVSLDEPITNVDQINLSYRDTVVAFEFTALDYSAPEKNHYRHQLVGFDQDWQDQGDIRLATYTNLAPGSYTFKVKASNNDGFWNEEGLSVAVIVSKPPWRTPGAYLIYTLAGLGAVLLIFKRLHTRKLAYETSLGKVTEEADRHKRDLARQSIRNEELLNQLEASWTTDALTGLPGRKAMETEMSVLHQAGHSHITFMRCDIDHFREYNFRMGLAAGDEVLKQVGDLLKQAIGSTDKLYRWAGDAFFVIRFDADQGSSASIAERIRSGIENHGFQLADGRQSKLTCSLAFAESDVPNAPAEGLSWRRILTLTDGGINLIKQSGRNGRLGLSSRNGTFSQDFFNRLSEDPRQLLEDETILVKASRRL